jgi:hypothetical protein
VAISQLVNLDGDLEKSKHKKYKKLDYDLVYQLEKLAIEVSVDECHAIRVAIEKFLTTIENLA